jgi:Flp pilus assembly pilin Flp
LPEAAKMVFHAGIAGSEEGQSLMEYALILVLVALVAITGLTAYGNQLMGVFQTIMSSLGSF